MKGATFAAVLVAALLRPSVLLAHEPGTRPWAPTNGALTVPEGRYELGLFSLTRYGLGSELEIASVPQVFFLFPQAELKYRFLTREQAALALRGRLAYPTAFLQAFSKSGALGLLPATTKPPQAIGIEAELIGSWLFASQQVASAWLGVAVAPHESSEDLPLLDFPFLYPRFAPLYTTAVPRAGLTLDGHIAGSAYFGVDLRGYVFSLDEVDGAFALEQGSSLEYRFGDSFAVEFALRTSLARYPIGVRLHFLPYLDFKFAI